ncbi:MAG: DMT family transporter, partial [Candidatus Latescibacteria bacterium]|nr:DMT family transporter [Candidatus Latescibacterota bacterium]
FVFNGLRLPVVSLLLFIVVKLRGGSISIQRIHLPLMSTVAFFGMFLNTVTAIWGLSLTTATNMGIITSTTPLFILIVSFAARTEHISKKLVTGLFIGICGVILINYRQGELAWNIGDILVMLSCLCFAVYAVFGKKIVDIYSAILTTAWMFLFAGIYQFPLFIYQLRDQVWNTIPIINWINLGFGAFGSFFAANVLFFYAIRKIGAVRAGVYLNLQPIFTLIFAYLIMGETVTLMKVTGLVIILIGIGITKIPPRMRPV